MNYGFMFDCAIIIVSIIFLVFIYTIYRKFNNLAVGITFSFIATLIAILFMTDGVVHLFKDSLVRFFVDMFISTICFVLSGIELASVITDHIDKRRK